MKVLQINALYGSKSTGLIVKDISTILETYGEQPYSLCIESTDAGSNILETGYNLEEKLHALLARIFGFQGFWSNFSTRHLLKKIKRIDPDIIHLHNVHSNFISLPMLMEYCAHNNKPVVVTLHDCWHFTGKCYHFADIDCERWLAGCGKCPKRMLEIPNLLCDSSRVMFNIKKKAFAGISDLNVVGCSKWITGKAEQSPIFRNASFHTIYNGVDTSIFKPDKSITHDKNKFTILVMANKWFLDENRNLRKELIQTLPEDCRIIVVGCNDSQFKDSKTNDRIKYIGYIADRQELAKFYNMADVFLNVTFIDTLPTVNMEAICCGTPVVTYRSGGSPELVQEGATGYIVEQNDINGIVQAIKKVREGHLSREKCGAIGLEKYDKNKCYTKYVELYNQIKSH